jgi:hypothetical protein
VQRRWGKTRGERGRGGDKAKAECLGRWVEMKEWGGKGGEGRKVERERGRRDAVRWGVERRRTGSICDDVRVIGGGGGGRGEVQKRFRGRGCG